MSTFFLKCGTCRAKLLVKHDQAIGQIHACPKCSSMVLIERPADTDTETPASPDGLRKSAAGSDLAANQLLANSFEQVEDLLANKVPHVMPTVEPLIDQQQPPGEHVSQRIADSHSVDVRRVVTYASLAGIVGAVLVAWMGWLVFQPANVVRRVVALPSMSTLSNVASEPASVKRSSEGGSVPEGLAGETTSAHENETVVTSQTVMKPVVPDDQPAEAIPLPTVDQPVAFEVDINVFAADNEHVDADVQIEYLQDEVDAASRIGQAIEALELPGTTVGAFCQLIEQMADVPITIQPSALAMARIGPSQRMEIHVRQNTLGETLGKGLRQFHLGFRVDGQHVLIEHRAQLDRRPAMLRLAVDDLAPAESFTQLDELIRRCVHPSLWGQDGARLIHNQQAIEVHADPLIQFDVVRFVERLRMTRGLTTRTVYGPQLEAELPIHLRGRVMLAQTIIPRWPRKTTLPELMDHWQRQAQGYFLIDWPALYANKIHPGCRWHVETEAASLRSLLASLEKVNLSFIAVADNIIRLTSLEAQLDSFETQFYSLDDLIESTGASADQIAATLQSSFASCVAQDGIPLASSEAMFTIEPVSQHLIVRLPPSLHARFGRGLQRLHNTNRISALPALIEITSVSP